MNKIISKINFIKDNLLDKINYLTLNSNSFN